MRLVFLLIFLVPFFSEAQDSLSKYVLGVSWEADVCYRLSASNSELKSLKNDFDSLETFRIGYAAGISGGFKLGNKVSILSGLTFVKRGYAIDTLLEAGLFNLKYNFNMLELPLRISYVFTNKRAIQPSFSIGGYVDYLISNRVSFERLAVSKVDSYEDKQPLNTLSYGVVLSAGFQRNFRRNYFFEMDCILRQSITSISNAPLKRYLNGVGLCLSVSKQF